MSNEPLLPVSRPTGTPNFSRRMPLVFWRGRANHQVLEALEDVSGISDFQKRAVLYRASNLLDEYSHRAAMYSTVYHVGRAIVTIGSLVVPALLSIQNQSGEYGAIVYWITWITSLFVTTFNGVLTLFKVEKKHNYLHTVKEQVRSECWQYIQLTGKYGGHHWKPVPSTHANELIFFTHALERIKLTQTTDEYWKSQDATAQTPATVGGQGSINGLYTPTPSTAQFLQVERAMNSAGLLDGSTTS